MSSEKRIFQNSKGEKLVARLELPIDQRPKAYALFAHCFTCNKNLNAVWNISRALTAEGFGVLRFDFTGLGESEGDFAETNFSSNIQDLVAAAQYMDQELAGPVLLIGHSLGGAAVIFAGKEIPSVQAIATIGAPSSPDHVGHLFQSSLPEIEEKGAAKLEIGGRQFTIKKQFIEDISAKNMDETLRTLRKPLLILHSPQDTIVGIKNAARIYTAAFHPKSFISLDGADHLLTDQRDSHYAGQVIASWASRYLSLPEKPTLASQNAVVAQIGSEGFFTEIMAGNHSLHADEPVNVGGTGLGPGPYDLLLAALGACTAMTMRMYADRKNWSVEEIRVHLDHKKDYASDCADCEKPQAKIDHIDKFIEIKGDLDDAQRDRLIQIAGSCPVHKSLHSEVEIRTQLKG